VLEPRAVDVVVVGANAGIGDAPARPYKGSQPHALRDLVSPLHQYSSELHQAEKGEQVHKIVEDEHL
jgi:hypothetical protein